MKVSVYTGLHPFLLCVPFHSFPFNNDVGNTVMGSLLEL